MTVLVVLGLAYGVVIACPSETALERERDATSVGWGWLLIVMCLVLAALNSAEPGQL